MQIKPLILAALFALPLTACEKEAEVSYDQSVINEDNTAASEPAPAGEQVIVDEDLQSDVELDQDLVEDRSAGVINKNADMGD